MKSWLWLFWAVISATIVIGKTDAATRIAIIGNESGGGVENVLDTATSLLSKDTDLQLLDRVEASRILREQAMSLAGMVRAEDAVKAGQLLHVDLFAVLEGTLTNGTEGGASIGLIVFDAKSGVRYADLALLASNAGSAASAVALAVRAAVVKSHQNLRDLHTVGLLQVHNADLPLQYKGLCDSVGLLLERELTASPGIAVLEGRRLEQVNKERGVAPGADINRLLNSLQMIELDISQDGPGLRGTLALIGADGARSNAVGASVSNRDPAALARLLAEKTERFLKAPSDGLLGNPAAEAERFHREYLLLLQHHDYFAAMHALDAASALAPEQKNWQKEMALLLPDAAIELVDPGGQNWGRAIPVQPSAADLAYCLALGERGADLLLDLSREAVAHTKLGEPIPEVLGTAYRGQLYQLVVKLAGIKTTDPVIAGEITALSGKDRCLRMEIIEPFLSKRSVDAASFAEYSKTIGDWLIRTLDQQDDVPTLSHWVELSHKINPPDGSGSYSLIWGYLFLTHHEGNKIAEFLKTWGQDSDPVIRLYARAGRVTSISTRVGFINEATFAAERDFRLYAQDMLAHGEAASPGPLRDQVWKVIQWTLLLLLNHPERGQENLEACRFAFAQKDIQPIIFYNAINALDSPKYRNVSGELEVVNGALKLILENLESYPSLRGTYYNRSGVINDLQQKRDGLSAELAGTNIIPSNSLPLPPTLKKNVCLLDIATPLDGFAWLFKPVVQDGQIFVVALGFHEWGLPEDSLQLIRVPLEGGSPIFLGRSEITGLNWVNRPYVLKRGPKSRLTDETPTTADVVCAACIGAGYYFAATGSGVYIFPTNGEPVLHLAATNGLPSDDTHAVAFLDGKLYIGMGEVNRAGYIATYEPATRKITALASSRRSEHLSPFDDQPPFYTVGFASDAIRHRLVMAISTVAAPSTQPSHRVVSPSMGIWSYLPATDEYKRLDPVFIATEQWTMRYTTRFEMADANNVVAKAYGMITIFDLRGDKIVSSYDPWRFGTNNTDFTLWRRPVPGRPGNTTIVDGPYFLRDGWFYSARPFERMALAGGRREGFPPLRKDYPFVPKESLQLLDDGNHVLAADQFSLWLLELAAQPESPPARKQGAKSALTKP